MIHFTDDEMVRVLVSSEGDQAYCLDRLCFAGRNHRGMISPLGTLLPRDRRLLFPVAHHLEIAFVVWPDGGESLSSGRECCFVVLHWKLFLEVGSHLLCQMLVVHPSTLLHEQASVIMYG